MSKENKILLERLKNALPVFDETSAENKWDLLKKCSAIKLSDPKLILDYHGILLFILGYCEGEELHGLAKSEMDRLALCVKDLSAHKKNLLERSGVAFSETQGAYSLSLIKW